MWHCGKKKQDTINDCVWSYLLLVLSLQFTDVRSRADNSFCVMARVPEKQHIITVWLPTDVNVYQFAGRHLHVSAGGLFQEKQWRQLLLLCVVSGQSTEAFHREWEQRGREREGKTLEFKDRETEGGRTQRKQEADERITVKWLDERKPVAAVTLMLTMSSANNVSNTHPFAEDTPKWKSYSEICIYLCFLK